MFDMAYMVNVIFVLLSKVTQYTFCAWVPVMYNVKPSRYEMNAWEIY